MLKLIFLAKNSGNSKCPKEVGFFHIWLNMKSMGYPKVPAHFAFVWQDSKCIAKPCPPLAKPNCEVIWATVMKIEELWMGVWSKKESSKPCHFVIIIIVTLRMVALVKVSIYKGILPVTWHKNPFNNIFGKHDQIGIMFISSLGNCDRLRINEYELIKFLSFD